MKRGSPIEFDSMLKKHQGVVAAVKRRETLLHMEGAKGKVE